MKLSIWTIFKSGFKLGYSTEMALAILANNLWRAQVAGGAIVLVVLALSIIFNAINHVIILRWL